MPLTAKLGTTDSRPGNIVLGLGSARFIPTLTAATPATLVVEVAFPNNPIDLAGYQNTVLADNPTSYWRMNNTTSLGDLAGAGNTMTLDATPTLVAGALAGDSDQALLFNGTTQDGTVPDAPSMSPTGVMSLELWLQFSAAPGTTRTVVGKTRSYWLELRTDRKLQFSVRSGSTVTTLVSASVLSTATWYHIACVYDGSNLKIYLNQVQDATTTYSSGISATTFPLTVARTDDSTASPGWRGASGPVATSGLGTSIAISTPAGTVTGDYLVAAIRPNNGNSCTPPAGWTLLGTSPGSSGSFQLFMYGKIATGADAAGGATYTWTIGSAISEITGMIAAFSAVGATGVTASAGNSSTSISAGLTPAYSNTLVAAFFAASSVRTWTETPGTERADAQGMALETTAVGVIAAQTETGTPDATGPNEMFALELVGVVGATSFTGMQADEISLWNVGLSAGQVAAHYAAAAVVPTTLTWTDISADVRECHISRGRQYELDQVQAGTATLVLKDQVRAYDPANTLSPYAPNVVPLRQIRVRAFFNSVYYPLFRGFVERWESKWSTDYVQNYAEIDLTAVDGFEPLSLVSLVGTIPAGSSGLATGSLLSRANWPAASRVLDSGAFAVASIVMDGSTSILSYLQDIANGEGGLFFIDASGNAVFHDKNHRSTNTLSTVSQGTFSDVPEGALPYTELVPSFDKDHITNDWHVTDSSGGDHQASDQTSINKYFRRTQSRSSFLSSGDATTVAAALLARTKDPGYRFDQIEVTPNTTLEVWLQALQREISDRITVHRQPVGIVPGSQIAKDCWVERVEWTIAAGQPWRVRWQLSPAT